MTDLYFKKMETNAVSKDVIFHLLENSFFMSTLSFLTWKDGATQSRENGCQKTQLFLVMHH